MLRRKFFGNVKKHAQRNASANELCDVTYYSDFTIVDLDLDLVLAHYCDARRRHMTSIKCKKQLGRPGTGELKALPKTPS